VEAFSESGMLGSGMRGRFVGAHRLSDHTGTYDTIGQLGLHTPNPPTVSRTTQAGMSRKTAPSLAHKAGLHVL